RREAERVLLIHRRDVIQPVEIADILEIGLVLDQLLGAAMEEPDMRIDSFNHLAVELKHQAQHAVCRGMLWPEIDREVSERLFGHGSTGFRGFFVAGEDVVSSLPRRQKIESTKLLRKAHRVVD